MILKWKDMEIMVPSDVLEAMLSSLITMNLHYNAVYASRVARRI